MSKLMQGLPPTCVTQQSHQLDTTAELPLGDQFEAIENQATQAALAGVYEHPEQTVSITEISAMEITLEIYLS